MNKNEKISPHLPKEVRQQGKGDTKTQLVILKTVGLAALFGFFSGLVGALVITSHLVDDWLYGQGSAGVTKTFSVYPSGRSLTRDALVKKVQGSLVSVYHNDTELGAGFFLTNDGWLGTTAAVVDRLAAKDLKVITAKKEILTVNKIVFDSASDLVLLKAGGEANIERTALPFTNDNYEIGSQLLAASANQGLKSSEVLLNNFLPRQRRGEVFSSDRVYRFGLFADNLTKPSLGAPLVNYQGEVAGLIIKLGTPDLPRALFLPSSLIRDALNSLLSSDKGLITRPALGAHFLEASATAPSERGIILRDDLIRNLPAVEKSSPLSSLGLKAADKIIAINNETITDVRTLPEIILDYAPGSKVTVTYEKGGRVLTEAVILGAH